MNSQQDFEFLGDWNGNGCNTKIGNVSDPYGWAQDEPHKIFEHADFWLPKMRRLRMRGLLPETTLISTEAPPEDDAKRFKAFAEVRDELIGLNLLTAAAQDEAAIRRFALA